MVDPYDIYKARLNRYGLNYQERIQNQREENFEQYLLKTIYRVDFEFNRKNCPGSLERYKQNETRILQYLLTRYDLIMPNGTIIEIKNKHTKQKEQYMVWYLEDIRTSGYNKYVMLKMTHFIKWTARDGSKQSSYAYMYGQENNMLHDELKSRSRSDTVYNEDLKSDFFIMPRNQFIQKDIYIEVGKDPFKESYRVTGYDIQSSPGVEYVTIDPTYEYDLTPAPEKQEGDRDEEFYWITGGKS